MDIHIVYQVLAYLATAIAFIFCWNRIQRMGNKVDDETDILCNWLDLEIELLDWIRRNPGVYIGLSIVGKGYVCKAVVAWDQVLQTRVWRDNGHRAILVGLLDDLPPKSPNEYPKSTKERALGALAFY